MQPQAFYRAVADDFSAVDGIIKKQLTSRVPLVSKIGDYITSAGGKRLRPLLVLLCGKALGREGDDMRLLAATIEFLHTATLLHDDVVDMSGMRRGRSTANAMWGQRPERAGRRLPVLALVRNDGRTGLDAGDEDSVPGHAHHR
jgi:octaprenyl-diphosphate synthase